MSVHRREGRRRYLLLLLVLTAVTLVTLDSRRDDGGPLGVVGRAAHVVVAPFERAVDAVADPLGDWFDGVTDGRALKRENEELRERIAELEDAERRARTVLRENEELRRLHELPVLDDVERTTAQVVHRSVGNFEWTITIDKGSEHGISPDMPVLAVDGLVGKVLESWRGGAKVRLLVDPDSNVAVRVDPDGATGVAEGRAGSDLLRVDLDDDDRVFVGNTVVTSGLENSVFPGGLPVGRVAEVEDLSGGRGRVARVAPFVDFDALEFVTVLRWVPGQGRVVAPTTTTTAPPAAAPAAPQPDAEPG
ncbi:MAG: rod shape-determining protein MreC [Acidimicrobiia bacterium]|nr:MAG: rod shape-determining protein MreC [Acidimicrobiia bacterium]